MTQQAILRDRTMLRATSVDFPATPKISDAAKDFCRKCLAHSSLERPTVAELEQHAYLASRPQRRQHQVELGHLRVASVASTAG